MVLMTKPLTHTTRAKARHRAMQRKHRDRDAAIVAALADGMSVGALARSVGMSETGVRKINAREDGKPLRRGRPPSR